MRSGPSHPDNSRKTGFLRNTGPDPLKITKLPSHRSLLGHHRLDDGPLLVVFGSSPLIKKKKKNCQRCWTPSDKTFWVHAFCLHGCLQGLVMSAHS